MDFAEFLDNFKVSDNPLEYKDSIINGFEQSEFQIDTKGKDYPNFYEMIKILIDNYDYYKFSNKSDGMPGNNDKKNKVSYTSDFSIVISNIVSLFGFELVRSILYHVNIKYILSDIVENMGKSKNIKGLSLLFIKYHNLFTKYKLAYNTQEFINELNETKFNKQYKCNNILQVFDIIYTDFLKRDETFFNEISEEIINVLTLLNNNLKLITNIDINSIDDIISNLGQFDKVYQGSFLMIAKSLYEVSTKKLESAITRYGLKNIVNDNIIPPMGRYIEKLLNLIVDNYPTLNITISEKVQTNFIYILICFFITFGLKIANIYNLGIAFDKSSRIQFKHLFQAFTDVCLPLNGYTQSQKEFLHYVLMSSKNMSSIFKEDKKDQKKKKNEKKYKEN